MSNTIPDGSVRQFFARLSLRGQSRSLVENWPRMQVEQFFVALSLPSNLVNRDHRECGVQARTLGSLFADIRWS